MFHKILSHIYPISPPRRRRDPHKPMQIITLGLPRSYTESLRTALVTLGYGTVWHGFEMALNRPNESILWTQLLHARERGDKQTLEAFDWDTLLGDCEAMLDNPAVMFAEEYLDFYPDAKVILNRRKDMDAWHRSLSKAVNIVMGSWMIWVASWFDAELFWWYSNSTAWIRIMSKGGSFDVYGKEWAEEFYERLVAKMEKEGRSYLEWEAKDGWKPLCEYLQRDIPEQDFPWMNKTGSEFQKNADNAVGKMLKRGLMRGFLILSSGIVAIAITVQRFR